MADVDPIASNAKPFPHHHRSRKDHTMTLTLIAVHDLSKANVGTGIWLPTVNRSRPGVLLDIRAEAIPVYPFDAPNEWTEAFVLLVGEQRVKGAAPGTAYRTVQHIVGRDCPVIRFDPAVYISVDHPDDLPATEAWYLGGHWLPEGADESSVAKLPLDRDADVYA
jgi:hypothetical protein